MPDVTKSASTDGEREGDKRAIRRWSRIDGDIDGGRKRQFPRQNNFARVNEMKGTAENRGR